MLPWVRCAGGKFMIRTEAVTDIPLRFCSGARHRVLVHRPEGCIFLWVWFRDLPIRAEELYRRLKVKGVLIIPGHLFFPGQGSSDWAHKHECIRMSYGSLTDDEMLRAGIRLIASEAAAAYQEGEHCGSHLETELASDEIKHEIT